MATFQSIVYDHPVKKDAQWTCTWEKIGMDESEWRWNVQITDKTHKQMFYKEQEKSREASLKKETEPSLQTLLKDKFDKMKDESEGTSKSYYKTRKLGKLVDEIKRIDKEYGEYAEQSLREAIEKDKKDGKHRFRPGLPVEGVILTSLTVEFCSPGWDCTNYKECRYIYKKNKKEAYHWILQDKKTWYRD
jgi:hypothetical protein